MTKKSNFKYILGIQCFATMDSGACIIKADYKKKDYQYVAISEERLIRKKYPYTFPLHSIKYCMDHFKINKLNEIDLLVSDIIREPVWERSGPSYNVTEFDYIKSILNFPKKKITQINHHLAHAASVYYTSGFKNSAILVIDGNGTDLETNSFYEGKNKKIKHIDKYKARGIGVLYGAITSQCLNLGTGGEGKTMGLAPYGKKGKSILDFSKVRFEGIKTDYSCIIKRQHFTDIMSLNHNKKIESLLVNIKKRKINDSIMKKKWRKIAFDIQAETERCMIHLGKEINKKVKSRNICLAGGVALNSVGNQKLFDNTNFKNISVYPACSDAGIPFGLAIWAIYNHKTFNKKKIRLKKLKNAYTGIKYNSHYINIFLKKNNIKSEKINLSKIVKMLTKGKIVGWFQNESEYGPRALGNRSILADSRNPKIRDYINEKVKHREKYRPFAPAVLEEDYKKFFKLKSPSPFMLLVAKVKNVKKIPSVSHVDGTARVQTVNKNQNEVFYNLIKEFKKQTGVGCVLNTSFNDAGEPIVETPRDAMITFSKTKIDYLVLGDRFISRADIRKLNINKLNKDRDFSIKNNEKKAINLITRRYNLKNRNKYYKVEEKKAYWSCIDKPLVDLKDKVNYWERLNTKIILYGTYDQTNMLFKKIKNLNSLNIVGFLPYKNVNDDKKNIYKTKFPFPILNTRSKVLKKKDYEFLISSYEYLYDIEREIIRNYKKIRYFKFYNGYTRDLRFHSNLKRVLK